MSAAVVHLDVGGVPYTTHAETLTRHSEYFTALFHSRPSLLHADANIPVRERSFSDRDGALFGLLLISMRSDELPPFSPPLYTLLLAEADHFVCPRLSRRLACALSSAAAARAAAAEAWERAVSAGAVEAVTEVVLSSAVVEAHAAAVEAWASETEPEPENARGEGAGEWRDRWHGHGFECGDASDQGLAHSSRDSTGSTDNSSSESDADPPGGFSSVEHLPPRAAAAVIALTRALTETGTEGHVDKLRTYLQRQGGQLSEQRARQALKLTTRLPGPLVAVVDAAVVAAIKEADAAAEAAFTSAYRAEMAKACGFATETCTTVGAGVKDGKGRDPEEDMGGKEEAGAGLRTHTSSCACTGKIDSERLSGPLQCCPLTLNLPLTLLQLHTLSSSAAATAESTAAAAAASAAEAASTLVLSAAASAVGAAGARVRQTVLEGVRGSIKRYRRHNARSGERRLAKGRISSEMRTARAGAGTLEATEVGKLFYTLGESSGSECEADEAEWQQLFLSDDF